LVRRTTEARLMDGKNQLGFMHGKAGEGTLS
jgi:hypothetical protein